MPLPTAGTRARAVNHWRPAAGARAIGGARARGPKKDAAAQGRVLRTKPSRAKPTAVKTRQEAGAEKEGQKEERSRNPDKLGVDPEERRRTSCRKISRHSERQSPPRPSLSPDNLTLSSTAYLAERERDAIPAASYRGLLERACRCAERRGKLVVSGLRIGFMNPDGSALRTSPVVINNVARMLRDSFYRVAAESRPCGRYSSLRAASTYRRRKYETPGVT